MGARLTLRLLGEVRIALDGEPVTGLPSRAAEALLIYLACQREPVSRERLADLFWDDRDPKQAAANLRSVLSSLRRQLAPFLAIDRQTVGFNHGPDTFLDVMAFESALSIIPRSRDQWEVLSPDQISSAREALSHYRGDFLSGFYLREGRDFEEWAVVVRERLRRQAATALRQLVYHALEHGHYHAGIPFAYQLLRLDPYSEAAHRQLMLLLARTGQRAAALHQYEQCRRLLDEELGVPPLEETTALYDRIRNAHGIGSHNLPAQATPFVGREAEITVVREQLARPDCRLLTLLGPGGIGKTRLALQTAVSILENSPGMFLDGVRFVSLAPTLDPSFIATTIGEAVGLEFRGAAPPDEQLGNLLREREMLIVLDNMEHLLEYDASFAYITSLVERAHGVTLLVTSRERLALQEEWVHDVLGLDVPPADDDAGAEAYSAVRLFLQTARRLRRDFAPSATEMTAIIQICRLLAGMPLGIELAAAWIRQLAVPAIAEQIQHGLDVLTAPWRNQPERHRSLRAVFDHSWALLSPVEQDAFSQLAVFRGRFTDLMGQAVTGAPASVLRRLADRSLLRRGQDGRYELHPMLQHYALERLEDTPYQADGAVQRHANYFAAFLAAREPHLNSPSEKASVQEIEDVIDDVEAAWEWVLRQEDARLAQSMLYGLAYTYDQASLFQVGLQVFSAALESTAAVNDEALDARLRMRCGRAAFRLGRLVESRAFLVAALPVIERLGRTRDLVLTLAYLSELERVSDDLDGSQRYARRCLEIALASGTVQDVTIAYLYMGNSTVVAGQLEEAKRCYEAGLAIGQGAVSPRQVATYLDNLGSVAREMGDFAAAKDRHEESLRMRERLNDRWGMAVSAHNLAVAATDQGDLDTAESMFNQAAALFQEIGHQFGMAQTLTNLSETLLLRRQWDRARQASEESLAIWRVMNRGSAHAQVVEQLGMIAWCQGREEEAVALLKTAADILHGLGKPAELAGVLSHLALAAAEAGDPTAAQRILREAVALAEPVEALPALLRAAIGWAAVLRQLGRARESARFLRLVETHAGGRPAERLLAQTMAGRWELTPGDATPATLADALEGIRTG